MKLDDLTQIVGDNLFAHRLRALLTIVGITIGIAAVIAVVAIAIPIDPPMLRSMLKRPVALPISFLEMVRVDKVARGTKTKLSAKPVSVMGKSSV